MYSTRPGPFSSTTRAEGGDLFTYLPSPMLTLYAFNTYSEGLKFCFGRVETGAPWYSLFFSLKISDALVLSTSGVFLCYLHEAPDPIS